MADVMSVQCQPTEIQGWIQDFPFGVRQPEKKERTTYYFTKFPQKLHEMKKIGPGGEGSSGVQKLPM